MEEVGYRIGSFNIRKLSYATKDDELGDGKSCKRNYAAIGDIIRTNFDIVALQEIMTDNVLRLLFPPGSGWQYRWKASRSKVADSNEGYAFAWNTDRISLAAEPDLWIQYQRDAILGQRGLVRHPYYGRFIPSNKTRAAPFCEFRLINTHIRFKPSKDGEAGEASTYELRRRELKVLIEQILNRLESRSYGNHRPAYTFLMGDYNLNLKRDGTTPPYLEEFACVKDDRGGKQKIFVTVQDKLTTLKKRKDPRTAEFVFDGFANNYDHFTYNEAYSSVRKLHITVDAIDSVTLHNKGFEGHWREISDHIPIVIEIKLK